MAQTFTVARIEEAADVLFAVVDEHLDKAFASLDDVPVRELQATADALERSRDGLGKFSGVFRDVADAREGGWGASLARYHLGENVRRADQELAERIADAQAPFWAMCATRYWLVEKRKADYQVSVR